MIHLCFLIVLTPLAFIRLTYCHGKLHPPAMPFAGGAVSCKGREGWQNYSRAHWPLRQSYGKHDFFIFLDFG